MSPFVVAFAPACNTTKRFVTTGYPGDVEWETEEERVEQQEADGPRFGAPVPIEVVLPLGLFSIRCAKTAKFCAKTAKFCARFRLHSRTR